MKLREQILKALNEFSDIVAGYKILHDIDDDNRAIFYLKINLTNTEVLFSRDVVVLLNNHSLKRKYAYQWMDADNQLIIRWDNAEHHPELTGAPFHKHIETDENVKPAPEVTLREVLLIIRAAIAK